MKRLARGLNGVALFFVAALFAGVGPARAQAGELNAVPAGSTTVERKLPPYYAPYDNGLYATIAGFNCVRDFKLCNVREERLHVDGFNYSVPVRTLVQGRKAPLVVLLLGTGGRATDPLAKKWFSWLDEAGCHVLSFNSTLQADFVGICGRGVSGYFEGEAESARDIVAAYLKTPDMRDNYTEIVVVGMSYGGLQALLLARMSAEDKFPFKVGAVQAYSPPLDMMRSAALIDRWWREDRWNFTLAEIYFTVGKHKPVAPGCDIPLSESLMRASVAASFRLDFVDVVDRNDSEYDLNLLPAADNFKTREDRRDRAAGWGLHRFLRDGVYPYWKDKLKLNDFSAFNSGAKLCNLAARLPASAEIVIADDDPLNAEEDLKAFRNCRTSAKLTVLRGGGHIGYINEEWTKANLKALFDNKQ